jgi:hypothetical protein
MFVDQRVAMYILEGVTMSCVKSVHVQSAHVYVCTYKGRIVLYKSGNNSKYSLKIYISSELCKSGRIQPRLAAYSLGLYVYKE